MFGIGMPELLLLLAIALIVVGPKKLPELAKALGRGLAEFKKATNEIKESLETNTEFSELKQSFDDIQETVVDASIPADPNDEAETVEVDTPDISSDQEYIDDLNGAAVSGDDIEDEETPPSPTQAPEKSSHGDK
ncbi:MAG: Sec-independent protein translocase protein TatB, partial [Deltaproteobacteria bacterium]